MQIQRNEQRLTDCRRRARQLVAQMTLEEKVSQTLYDSPAIPRLHIPAYNWWNEALHGVARAGTATVFPQAIAMAAAFSEEMMQAVGQAVSTEARAKYNAQRAAGDRDIYKGLTLWAPNVNIFRDPRWGRGQETYGEDPFLTSRLAVSYIRGLQGEDSDYLKTAAPKRTGTASTPGWAGRTCTKPICRRSGPAWRKPGWRSSWGRTTV